MFNPALLHKNVKSKWEIINLNNKRKQKITNHS